MMQSRRMNRLVRLSSNVVYNRCSLISPSSSSAFIRYNNNNNNNHSSITSHQSSSSSSFHSNTLNRYARKKATKSSSSSSSSAAAAVKQSSSSSSSVTTSNSSEHSASTTTTTAATVAAHHGTSTFDQGANKSSFLHNGLSDKSFAKLASKSLEDMTPRERRLLKQQLEKNFLQNFRSNLVKDNAEVASQVSDGEILDFARELTRGAIRHIPQSALQKKKQQQQQQSAQIEAHEAAVEEAEEEDDYPSFTNVKKEVGKMTMEEKNSVYTFTLYRIMLKLMSGKRLDRGNLRENTNEDAPLLSKSEQLALRREAKRQFLANAGITDQKQIISCFHRAEHAIHRFNAMQLGNHSLPPRTTSDKEKYRRVEEMGEPDSPMEKYWNEYYKQEGSLDEWYCDYEPLKNFFSQIQRESSPDGKPFNKALILGCGMSSLGAELSSNSFAKKITQVDISKFAIIHMEDAYKSLLKKQNELLAELPPSAIEDLSILEFKHVDVREMEEDFEDETFDVIVDKACFDTVLTSETGEIDVPDMEIEAWRVLKSHTGVWVIVSVLPLEGIESLLIQRPWKIDCLGSVPFAANQAQAHVYRLIKTHDEYEAEEAQQQQQE